MCAKLLLFAGLAIAGSAVAQDNPAASTDAAQPSADGPWGAASPPEQPAPSRALQSDPADSVEASELNRELLTVEQSVNNLKEKVFRSKSTLKLLRELVIEGATMGSRVSVIHVNNLGGAYMVESVQYLLDGKAIYNKSDAENGLNDLTEIEVHGQALPPGMHTLRVSMKIRGNGMGVFSYLKAYSFTAQTEFAFQVEDGKLTTVRVVAHQKGGAFKSFVDKVAVEFEDKIESLRQE